MDGGKDLAAVSDVGNQRPRLVGEQGMSAALEALQLQLLERWSSLLLRTFVSLMADHATMDPVQSELIAFYVALANLHGPARGLRPEADPSAQAGPTNTERD